VSPNWYNGVLRFAIDAGGWREAECGRELFLEVTRMPEVSHVRKGATRPEAVRRYGSARARGFWKAHRAIGVVFLLGLALRAVGLERGFHDPDWRTMDIAAVARNFYEEGMNPLEPRIDWRGDGPGIAEMELPIQSWLMALTYQVTGVHPVAGRWIAFFVSLLGLAGLFHLAHRRLTETGAVIACGFFAVNPLLVDQASSLQPEPFMTAAFVWAVLWFGRWIETGTWRDGLSAGVLAALAILAKAPAAHIGLVFLALALLRRGPGCLRDPRLWAIAFIALIPPVLWYTHAHGLYETYGNSLGLSNESHWIGLDMLATPGAFWNVVRNDVGVVWTGFGVCLLVAAAVLRPGLARRDLEWAWFWSAALFLVVAARTTGDPWARHYHVAMAPPAGLLLGAAAEELRRQRPTPGRPRARGVLGAMSFGLPLAVVLVSGLASVRALAPRHDHPFHRSAARLRAIIPPEDLLVASGGPCADEWNRPVAYNAPYFFYWLHAKGWNVCRDSLSVAKLEMLAARGAKRFLAEASHLKRDADVDQTLRARFPILWDDGHVVLFELSTGPPPRFEERSSGQETGWPTEIGG